VPFHPLQLQSITPLVSNIIGFAFTPQSSELPSFITLSSSSLSCFYLISPLLGPPPPVLAKSHALSLASFVNTEKPCLLVPRESVIFSHLRAQLRSTRASSLAFAQEHYRHNSTIRHSTFDSISRVGILFHLDFSWQSPGVLLSLATSLEL